MRVDKVVLFAGILACAGAARAVTLMVEAEAFKDKGGWVVDQQFMDQMGSPFLMAHGLGTPVADAATTVQIPEAGTYRVLARTRNWVAHWSQGEAPGRFRVLVNGKPLEAELGTKGAAWDWQEAGAVALEKGAAQLALRDVTGFNGRCDALILTTEAGFAPAREVSALEAFRRQMGTVKAPQGSVAADLIVVGGGIPGVCAAISAARLGLSVALIQDRPVLGGNNSSEVRVWLQGARSKEPWPRVGDIVAELEQETQAHYGPSNTAEIYEDGKKLAVARAETNLTLFLEHRVTGAECAGGRIRAALAQDARTGRLLRLAARVFADCTGDAWIGYWAGAEYRRGREAASELTRPRAPAAADAARSPV
jgi:hypothetical protein